MQNNAQRGLELQRRYMQRHPDCSFLFEVQGDLFTAHITRYGRSGAILGASLEDEGHLVPAMLDTLVN